MNKQIVVVIGAGGIGQAIGRRQGSGKTVVLADRNGHVLASAAAALEADGHDVASRPVDVSSRESVRALAHAAAGLGDVVQVVHTAGLSPVQAPPEAILAVDLVGTALVLEEFGQVVAAGGAGLVISSMAGYMQPPLDPEAEQALAGTPAGELLNLPYLAPEAVPNSGTAYALSKRANHLRVQAAALTWGERGARVNSISPGIILTPLARGEMSGPAAEGYQNMIRRSAAGRVGTPVPRTPTTGTSGRGWPSMRMPRQPQTRGGAPRWLRGTGRRSRLTWDAATGSSSVRSCRKAGAVTPSAWTCPPGCCARYGTCASPAACR